MRGGNYLGKGTYGCVYSPPIRCNDKMTYVENVGKIFFHKEDALEEMHVSEKILNRIDPNGLFTNKLIDTCKISKQDYNRIVSNKYPENASTCNVGEDTLQLMYEHKGKSIDEILNAPVEPLEYKYIYYEFLPVLEGLQTMIEKKVVHRDIKPANLVKTANKVLLIDFGLADGFHTIFERESDYILKHNYIYYPPEFTLRYMFHELNSLYKIPENFVEISVKKCMKKYQKVKFRNLDIDLRSVASSIEEFYEDIVTEVYRLRNETSLTQESLNDKVFSKFAKKIDIFSIGMVFLEIYELCLTQPSLTKYKPTVEFKREMKSLITMCIEMNPNLRITIHDLQKKYMHILQEYVMK